jgi:hypothetical protein
MYICTQFFKNNLDFYQYLSLHILYAETCSIETLSLALLTTDTFSECGVRGIFPVAYIPII